jgi:pectin methylesterase-like acyl-CoA thioesterase
VRCNNLTLSNLTIRNTTPQGGTQAEAIIFNGNRDGRAIVTGVELYSFQDTLQINGQAYVSDCYIEGDVDFMWGTGPCFFENCTARTVRNNAYYTQIRNTQANHGYVYYRCTFDGAAGITGNVLSRIDPARFPYSEVVLIDCVLGPAVSPAAWRLDGAAGRGGGDPSVTQNIRFWEFNSHDTEGRSVDVSQRLSVARHLKQPEDTELIRNYSDPVWVLGSGWNPRDAGIFKSRKP